VAELTAAGTKALFVQADAGVHPVGGGIGGCAAPPSMIVV
jgi:hypothetical protein